MIKVAAARSRRTRQICRTAGPNSAFLRARGREHRLRYAVRAERSARLLARQGRPAACGRRQACPHRDPWRRNRRNGATRSRFDAEQASSRRDFQGPCRSGLSPRRRRPGAHAGDRTTRGREKAAGSLPSTLRATPPKRSIARWAIASLARFRITRATPSRTATTRRGLCTKTCAAGSLHSSALMKEVARLAPRSIG